MSQGIYLLVNDRVIDQAIALINSIRHHDPETPICLIPYDERFWWAAKRLTQFPGVSVYENLSLVESIAQRVQQIFGPRFFARPNQFRKQACWLGPFDEFLYVDTDIVVFERMIETLHYLKTWDFVCCDYQHRTGIQNVFTPGAIATGAIAPADLSDIFNCGFWGSKKGVIVLADLYDTLEECARHPEYFDFSQKTSDQPIINYLILKRVPRRFNSVRRPGGAPGNWAGSLGFQRVGDRLFDPRTQQPLQYLHWAGYRIEPGCPYWDIWHHYRHLNKTQS